MVGPSLRYAAFSRPLTIRSFRRSAALQSPLRPETWPGHGEGPVNGSSTSTAWRGAFALAGVVALATALPSGTSAQTRMKKSEPTLIYVPTPQNVVDKMLEVAKVTKDDYVFDLGSGDGRIPITAAARYGARGFGVDISPKLIAEARANAKLAGVADRVEFASRTCSRPRCAKRRWSGSICSSGPM